MVLTRTATRQDTHLDTQGIVVNNLFALKHVLFD